MGVKSLWSLLTPVGRPVMLETMEGKAMAIDSSIWIYQFQATMRDKDGRGLVNAHVLGFLRRICKLLYYGIKPVFVFDGGAPTLKRQTIGERKKKKMGASETHAKVAEKLLAAQMRREAIMQAQKDSGKGKSKIPQGSVPIDENTVFLEDLEYPALTTPPKEKSKAKETPSTKKKNRWQDHDPYRLPDVDMHAAIARATRTTAPDPRLATEEELRTFIEEMRPEDLDVTSPAFRELPTEVQYEIIGDLRLKSRQTSYKRLQSMIRNSQNSLDFSKAQIMNLKQRNALTQQLLETTDSIGNAHISIPIRIASERNREYILMKNEGEGGGWILGIRDEGTKAKPIQIDVEDKGDIDVEERRNNADESDLDMEEVAIPVTTTPDPDLREYRRELALQGLARRQVPDKSRTFKRITVPTPKTPSKSKRVPLFDLDDDEDSAQIRRDRELLMKEEEEEEEEEEDDVNIAIAMQASLEQQEEEELRQAIEASRSSESLYKPGESSTSVLTAAQQNGGFAQTALAVSEAESDEDLYLPRPNRLDTALSIANIGSSSSGRARVSLTSTHRSENIFGSPTLLRPLPKAITKQDMKSLQPPVEVEESDDDDMEEVIVSTLPVPVSPSPLARNIVEFGVNQAANSPTTQKVSVSSPSIATAGHTESSARHSSVTLQDRSMDESILQSTSLPACALDSSVPNLNVDSGDEMEEVHISDAPTLDILDATATVRSTAVKHAHVHSPVPITTPSPERLPLKSSIQTDTQVINDMDHIASSHHSSSEPPVPSRDELTHSPERGQSHAEDWSRSPSPEAEVEGSSTAAAAQDWDAAEEMDPVQEEGEFARFMSQVKGKDLDSVRKEIDEEIRSLHQQRKVAMRDSEDVTQQMISQIMTMLRLFGIPYITAPMEAEAQCAELVSLGLVDGIITDDSDVFLFGGHRVFKNMFNQAKTVECFLLSDLDRELGLDRGKLIRLAYLLGSDYVEGLPGVGPVVAMELLTEFAGHDGLHKFREWWQKVQTGRDIETDIGSNFRKRFKRRFKELYLPQDWPNAAVRDAYYHPTVDSSEEPFKWGLPDLDALRALFQDELGWQAGKVDELLLPIIHRMGKRGQANAVNKQSNLNDYFDISLGTGTFEPRKRQAYSSKRLQELVSEHRKKRRRDNAASDNGDFGDDDEDGGKDIASSSAIPPKKKRNTASGAKTKAKVKTSEDGSEAKSTKKGQGNKSGTRGGRRGRGRGRGRGGSIKNASVKSRTDSPLGSSEDEFGKEIQKEGSSITSDTPPLSVKLRPRPKPAYKGSKTAQEQKEASGDSSDIAGDD